jgi:hypothetical protein
MKTTDIFNNFLISIEKEKNSSKIESLLENSFDDERFDILFEGTNTEKIKDNPSMRKLIDLAKKHYPAFKKNPKIIDQGIAELQKIFDKIQLGNISNEQKEDKTKQEEREYIESIFYKNKDVAQVFFNEETSEIKVINENGDSLNFVLGEVVTRQKSIFEEDYDIPEYMILVNNTIIYEESNPNLLLEGGLKDAFSKIMQNKTVQKVVVGNKGVEEKEALKGRSVAVPKKGSKIGTTIKTKAFVDKDNKTGLIITKDEKTAKLLPQYIDNTLRIKLPKSKLFKKWKDSWIKIFTPTVATKVKKGTFDGYVFSYPPHKNKELADITKRLGKRISNTGILDDVKGKATELERDSEMKASEEYNEKGMVGKFIMGTKKWVQNLKDIPKTRKDSFFKILSIVNRGIVGFVAGVTIGSTGAIVLTTILMIATMWWTSKYVLRVNRPIGDIIFMSLRNVALGRLARTILGYILEPVKEIFNTSEVSGGTSGTGESGESGGTDSTSKSDSSDSTGGSDDSKKDSGVDIESSGSVYDDWYNKRVSSLMKTANNIKNSKNLKLTSSGNIPGYGYFKVVVSKNNIDEYIDLQKEVLKAKALVQAEGGIFKDLSGFYSTLKPSGLDAIKYIKDSGVVKPEFIDEYEQHSIKIKELLDEKKYTTFGSEKYNQIEDELNNIEREKLRPMKRSLENYLDKYVNSKEVNLIEKLNKDN